MNIHNDQLLEMSNHINSMVSLYRNKRYSRDELFSESKKLRYRMDLITRDLQKSIRQKKRPKAFHYSKEIQLIDQLEQSRAFQIFDQDISLIKNELKKELTNENYGFCFTLIELIFSSSKRSDSDKNQLSDLYSDLLKKTYVDTEIDSLRQAQVLDKHLAGIENNIGTDEGKLFSNVDHARAGAEIKYTLDLERSQKLPSFQTVDS